MSKKKTKTVKAAITGRFILGATPAGNVVADLVVGEPIPSALLEAYNEQLTNIGALEAIGKATSEKENDPSKS